MQSISITEAQARRFLLMHQRLWPPYQLKGKSDIYEFVRHVNCIQFDPLNIVGHNQELVLQSRVNGFQRSMLQQLLYEDRRLIDGWDKCMSIYCLEDWPFFRRLREKAEQSHQSQPVYAVRSQIRDEIIRRGPLSSAELDYSETVDWAWAPTRLARAALESMYFWGELIIHHKVHTRKVYDLAAHHLPESLLTAAEPNLSHEAYCDWVIHRRIGGIGLVWNKAGDTWLGLGWLKSADRTQSLARLLREGQIAEVFVEGVNVPLYIRSTDIACLEKAMEADHSTPQASILAPLDNLLWDRKLLKQLFHFDYCWEVYKPAAERAYGYYVLPVLYGDRFVARFDPGYDKKSGALIIRNWWWEPGIRRTRKLEAALARCFRRFSKYLNAVTIEVDPELSGREGLDWLKQAAAD